MTFDRFCHLLHTDWDRIVPPLGWYNAIKFNHRELQNIDGNQFHPMTAWIPDDIDFVGRFETLTRDINRLLGLLGLESPATFHRLNPGQHPSYEHYYTEETKDIVGELYRSDIERFDYAF